MNTRFPRITASRCGFSLVEVAIALAVVVVVLAGVAGTWGSGQSRLKSAFDMTIAAQLAKRISAEVTIADFPDVLILSGIVGNPPPKFGSLSRRYFSYVGHEMERDDPDRVYEVITRVSHHGQLPVQTLGGASRWNAQGQLMLMIEVVAAPPGTEVPLGADGMVDRTLCQWPLMSFPILVGGSSAW
jgi:prepilin-type N-terminal cleavage/methylation domain-containing protein